MGGYSTPPNGTSHDHNRKGIIHSQRATRKDFETTKGRLEAVLSSMCELKNDFGAVKMISDHMSESPCREYGINPDERFHFALDSIRDLKRAVERVLEHNILFNCGVRKEEGLRECVMQTIIDIYKEKKKDPYFDMKKDKEDYIGPFVELTQCIFQALGVYLDRDTPQPCGTTIKKSLDKLMRDWD